MSDVTITEEEYRRLKLVDEVMNPDGEVTKEDFPEEYADIGLPTTKVEMNGEKQYLDALQYTLDHGEVKENRTGINTIVCPHPIMIQHQMSLGFPLLTTKNVSFLPVRVELEGFLKGIVDKDFYKDRKCNLWNEWASPVAVKNTAKKLGLLKDIVDGDTLYPVSIEDLNKLDPDVRKKLQWEENKLGNIYGKQWRNFNNGIRKNEEGISYNMKGADQLKTIIDTLKTDPNSRRLVCSAWNPLEEDLALDPCHFTWMVQHINGTLNLTYVMRSNDSFLGNPCNQISYALLLHLISKETGMKEGVLTGVYNDFHIYETHIPQVKEQLSRDRNKYPLCKIETDNFTSIYDWNHTMTRSVGYKDNHYPTIKGDVAI